MKEISIYNNVFQFKVIWIIWEPEEFIDYMDKKWLSIWLDCVDWITHIWNNNTAYLYLNDISDFVLLHECIHIIQHIFHDKWITTWMENTEVLAYNVDWLYRMLLMNYHKWKGNDKWKTYK